jgi:CheY-like chemotaxis protein
MPTAVVCDDDEMMRSVMRDLAEQHGLEVVAETDHGFDVVELVRRFSIDVVLLDLVLPDVTGEEVLEQLSDRGMHPVVVVFTAYDSDDDRLHDLGVRDVVRKPDLDRLGEALERVARTEPGSGARTAGGQGDADRRHLRREVEVQTPAWRSPSGLEPASTLDRHLASCLEGDTVMALTVDGISTIAASYGATLAHDCMLEVARAFATTLRAQDSIIDEPACDGFLLVLRGGDERAGTASWDRARRILTSASAGLTPRATLVVVGADPAEARARAVGAVHSSPPASLNPA